MSGMLTAQSVLTCPHGGPVQIVPETTNVLAGGAPVVTAADTFTVTGCPFMIGIVPSPCLTVQWEQPAMQSNVGGNKTLTESSVGLCLSAAQAPQGPVMIVTVQTQVTGQ